MKTPEKDGPKSPTNLYTIFKKNFKSDSKKQRLIGGPGKSSAKSRLNGACGQDTILTVPKGLSVIDDQKNSIVEFNENGQEYVICKGGQGGNESNSYIGASGQKRFIRLDLKLLADIGLVGFPNAGKSSLLNGISKARPKIANYPFTTLKPNLGHLEYSDGRIVTMADLPGLIEGSHLNHGLGHYFLKHVERTKILLFVVDICGFQLSQEYPFRSAFETIVLLNKELELYNPDLLKKPSLLLINKMDMPQASEKLDQFMNFMDYGYEECLESIPEDMVPKERLHFSEIIPISAKNNRNSVQNVKLKVRQRLDKIQDDIELHKNKVKSLHNEIHAIIDIDDEMLM